MKHFEFQSGYARWLRRNFQDADRAAGTRLPAIQSGAHTLIARADCSGKDFSCIFGVVWMRLFSRVAEGPFR